MDSLDSLETDYLPETVELLETDDSSGYYSPDYWFSSEYLPPSLVMI